jgi:tight adherence protein C
MSRRVDKVRLPRLTSPGALVEWIGSSGANLIGLGVEPPKARRWGQCVLVVVSASLALGLRGLLLAAIVPAVLTVRRRSKEAARSRAVLRQLNDAVPLLQLAVGAGLTVRMALWSTVPWLRGDLQDKVRAVLQEAECGRPLADALDRLPDDLGESCRGLVSVLSAADRYGSPLAEPLALVGSELRLQRRRQLEITARRIPVRLLFPLALGVLPAFVLLTVVPLLVTSLEELSLPGV